MSERPLEQDKNAGYMTCGCQECCQMKEPCSGERFRWMSLIKDIWIHTGAVFLVAVMVILLAGSPALIIVAFSVSLVGGSIVSMLAILRGGTPADRREKKRLPTKIFG